MTTQELAVKIAEYEILIKEQTRKINKMHRFSPRNLTEVHAEHSKLRLMKALRHDAIEEYRLKQTKIDFEEL